MQSRDGRQNLPQTIGYGLTVKAPVIFLTAATGYSPIEP